MAGRVLAGIEKGIEHFWRSTRSEVGSLQRSVDRTAQSRISRQSCTESSSLRNRQTSNRRSSGVRRNDSFVSSSVRGVRCYSTYHGPSERLRRFETFKEVDANQKVFTLMADGLRRLGVPIEVGVPASEENLQDGWQKLLNLNPDFPVYDLENPARNLVHVMGAFNTYHPEVQEGPVVHDLNEALVFERFITNPTKAVILPFDQPSTEDGEVGIRMIQQRLEGESSDRVVVCEDGCSSGQHLTELVMGVQESGRSIRAIGTDIAFYDVATGVMLSGSLGIEDSCHFFSANALDRSSPRKVLGDEGHHITLGLRMLPVMDERKILQYMGKISQEMQSGDLWCGSIALPEGRFYERNVGDLGFIEKCEVRAIETESVGTTFVHKPDFGGVSDERLVRHFNDRYKELGLQVSASDLSNILLNTYMSFEQLEALSAKFGFKVTADPVVVDCEDNKRLVVMLEKI